ncbi:MAG: GAF domain-containing protein [bacterium]|nr:MAG: GAF domain-containing protein [bacterium]
MVSFGPLAVQRFVLRLFFTCGVLLWSYFSGNLSALIVSMVFVIYAMAVLIYSYRREQTGDEAVPFIFADIAFVGLLIGMSGGWTSEFHLLLYFIVALRAPYRSWALTLAIPAACSLAYAIPAWKSIVEIESLFWFTFLTRISLLWFLAPLLRIIGLRSREERERAERLTLELSSTHDEVRRYTAALEKANAQGEKRLMEITLLHQFVTEVRAAKGYEDVYQTVLKYVSQASEAPWIFLAHSRERESGTSEIRSFGDPPEEISRRATEAISVPRSDGQEPAEEWTFPGQGTCAAYFLDCCQGHLKTVTLLLIFPPNTVRMEEDQVEVLNAFLESLEMELELLRLQSDLRHSNERLRVSNHHLMRLHELQNELSRAFLASGEMDGVVQAAQEIMAKELFELDRLNLFLPNWDKKMLQCRTSVGIEGVQAEEVSVPMDERGGAISKAFREGKTIFFDGGTAVPPELRVADPFSRMQAIRSRIFVIVPLLDHRGEVLGVIGADRKRTHRPIPQETIAMLEFFARHLAMVLSLQEKRDDRP